MYEIEKGIPFIRKRKGKYDKATKMREVLNKLETGDSFLITKDDYYTFYNAVKYTDANKIFTSRKVDEKSNRIYRIK